MKSDEGIFKMLSKSSIIKKQYENVIHFLQENTLKHTLNKIKTPKTKVLGVFLF
tara:strand:+ start:408 stop:569 length:162 start_codon:yes stop_codon:yes gene_type:complete